MPAARLRWPWLAAAVVAVVVQLVLVYAPSSGGPPLFPNADKVIHVVIFALPVGLAILARLPWLPVVAVMAAHAPVSEIVQGTMLSQRSGDVWDAVADLVGVALGWFVATRLLPREKLTQLDA
ncbi:hypothetical protein BCF74_1032 [Knoellia remsis]|uniref:VanZ like protein n=1 Tax=Knoellia remsis TaxID=407159 RepID=A0A2T0UXZ4_9MICO|nr:hypothetical protein [Knoellia remsis]PRY62796.1 hypothetical protein BCF74_1032 [Knoellia remsis]